MVQSHQPVGRLSIVFNGLLIVLLEVMLEISVNNVRGNPCNSCFSFLFCKFDNNVYLSRYFIINDRHDCECFETRRHVQDKQVVVVHQLVAGVLLLLRQQGQLLRCKVEGRSMVGRGSSK